MSEILRRSLGPEEYSQNIILACHPRGGSTWLAEMICTLPEYEMIWEPFNEQQVHFVDEYGFGRHNYSGQDAVSEPESIHYIRELLTGKRLCGGYLGPYLSLPDLIRRIRAQRLLFKCTRANMVLGLISSTVPLRTILVLRHPCAVVASQMKHPGWEYVRKDHPSVARCVGDLLEDYPQWAGLWETVSTKDEILAFIWGARTVLPLRETALSEWCVTTYEDLVTDGHSELERIFKYLDHDVPEAAYRRFEVPSATTRGGSAENQGTDFLRTWRDRLEERQIQRILEITREMGIDFYTESLCPHSEQLGEWLPSNSERPSNAFG